MFNSQNTPYPLPYEERHLSYDERKHADVWPDGNRLAFVMYVATEEWQWDEEEPGPPKSNRRDVEGSAPSLSTRTAVRYGYEIGLRRLRDIFDDHGVEITFFTSGNAVEQHPEIMGELADAGHEVTAHAYSEGRIYPELSKEQQRQDVRHTADLIEELTGERPVGWLSPGALADEDLIEVLAEEGYLYNADLQDDELPYFMDVGDETLVQTTYRMVGNTNDYFLPWTLYDSRFPTDFVLDYLKSTFDAFYREASRRPLFWNYGMHPYVSGRPDAAYVLDEFLDYVQQYDDVWIPTYREVAEWWMEQYDDGYDV